MPAETLATEIGKEAGQFLAMILIEKTWKGVTKLQRLLDRKMQQLVYEASQQYVKNYAERHCRLKVLGMREPVALESIYITVFFLKNSDVRRLESVESLERAYRENRSFQPRNATKVSGIEVANQKQYLMVLGGPGVGKSTFLRKIGLEALKGKNGAYQHECIPVFLELKRFTSAKIDIVQAIIEEFKICGLPYAQESTQKLLTDGRLLILFDGLDEVPVKYVSRVMETIENFCDQYYQNRFIISCRIAAYRSYFQRFTDVAMAEFDNTQIKQFISNWFQSEEDKRIGTAKKCWEILQKPENSGAKELANTPLLLTFLCLVYDHSQHFANKRSGLYRQALRILLEAWAAEKRIMREEIHKGLSTELEEILLADIAYKGFKNDQLFFPRWEITRDIRNFISNHFNVPQYLNGEEILNAIAVQQGILVERAADIYSFCHLSFQEYLTAQYITDNHEAANLVNLHLLDKRWYEVFLLVAGLMRRGVDEFLMMMEVKARGYLYTPKLQGLIKWVMEISQGDGSEFSPLTQRSVALFLGTGKDASLELVTLLSPRLADFLEMTRILDLARVANPSYVRALNSSRTPMRPATPKRALEQALNHAIADELSRSQILPRVDFNRLMNNLGVLWSRAPRINDSYKVHQGFNSRIAQTWLTGLQLNSDLLNLSSAESAALTNYLYVNALIVRCQQAAVSLSKQGWAEVESRMLCCD
ncbi:NACHT domain-containing protein [Calothrix sp. NIES-3974]|uniref:NACHT domain-containing protein n=1 Tax=Calothrix sp. NIES-3974 TaxID=2005462 RepID=UPI000B5F7E7D|nr:NACHT domain-containing protein [Calothrix sp. NIES-3974]BAZ05026.1 signal transduction protein [Calothrix sp. NIES-3974]